MDDLDSNHSNKAWHQNGQNQPKWVIWALRNRDGFWRLFLSMNLDWSWSKFVLRVYSVCDKTAKNPYFPACWEGRFSLLTDLNSPNRFTCFRSVSSENRPSQQAGKYGFLAVLSHTEYTRKTNLDHDQSRFMLKKAARSRLCCVMPISDQKCGRGATPDRTLVWYVLRQPHFTLPRHFHFEHPYSRCFWLMSTSSVFHVFWTKVTKMNDFEQNNDHSVMKNLRK